MTIATIRTGLAELRNQLDQIEAPPEQSLIENRADCHWPEYRDDPEGFCHDILGEDKTVEMVLGGEVPAATAPWHTQVRILESVRDNARTFVQACHSIGKGLALDTLIPTPDGWTTMGLLRVGDIVFDEHGLPTEVVEAHAVRHLDCSRFTFDDGASIVCDDDHLWTTLDMRARGRIKQRAYARGLRPDWRQEWGESETRPVSEIAATLRTAGGQLSHVVPCAKPLDLPYRPLPVDPYVFGVWLGDGHQGQQYVTSADPEVAEECRRRGHRVRWRYPKDRTPQFALLGIIPALRATGAFDDKHVPEQYLRASVAQRLDLLAGLMDSDGWVESGSAACFCSTRKALADAVAELARSMGWKARQAEKRATLYGKDCGPRWDVRFVPDTVEVFRLPRKRDRMNLGLKKRSWFTGRTISAVDRVPTVPTRCIRVAAPSGLFLAGESMVPTHNTHIAARVLLWFMYTRAPAICLTTAPKLVQVRDLLWARVRAAYGQARVPLPGRCILTRLEPIAMDPEWFAVGHTARETEAFSGYHESEILIILDEAPGVPIPVWDGVEGMMSGVNVRLLCIGNPVERSGPFYQGCRSSLTNTIQISAYDHPNVARQKVIYPKAVAPGWPEERRVAWGEDHPLYLSRVKGEFPDEGEDSLIPLSWVQAAVGREVVTKGRTATACDVARFGVDETVIGHVVGGLYEQLEMYTGKSTTRTAGRLVRWARQSDVLVIDDVGVGGGVTDTVMDEVTEQLSAREAEEKIMPVNAGARPTRDGSDEFDDLGSEMAWTLREAFEESYKAVMSGKDDPSKGLSIPDDDVLIEQLTSRRYDFTRKGKIKVESKKDMRARGEASPDRADTLTMAWWGRIHRPPRAVMGRVKG